MKDKELAYICLKEQGTIKYISTSERGYVDGLGFVLYDHYNTEKKVKNLIHKGNNNFPEEQYNYSFQKTNNLKDIEELESDYIYLFENNKWLFYGNDKIWKDLEGLIY